MVFNRILEVCTRAGGKILSIHSRQAATPVLDALEAHLGAGTPILHWFSGAQRELERAIKLGCWFSVGLSMLSGTKGRTLIAKMPIDRVLTESDGPFAQVDKRAAHPSDTDRAAVALAMVWNKPVEEVRKQLCVNLSHL
jgi:TatD DNase family protein